MKVISNFQKKLEKKIRKRLEEEKVEVVAGVNLPMLIKISSLRNECEIKELIKISQESGRKYMNVASAFFGESKDCKKKD